jgi:hypothetical protein
VIIIVGLHVRTDLLDDVLAVSLLYALGCMRFFSAGMDISSAAFETSARRSHEPREPFKPVSGALVWEVLIVERNSLFLLYIFFFS